MVLLSEVKYETGVKNIKDVSPESVLSMLKDVRIDIGKLDCSFADADLIKVLSIVEAGKYEVNGNVSIHINLSSAKSVINAYREYSEGGCQSCSEFRKNVLNEDLDFFGYCDVKEDSEETPKKCGYGAGFSPLVRKHYQEPCKSWKPHFSPKLEELIRKE